MKIELKVIEAQVVIDGMGQLLSEKEQAGENIKTATLMKVDKIINNISEELEAFRKAFIKSQKLGKDEDAVIKLATELSTKQDEASVKKFKENKHYAKAVKLNKAFNKESIDTDIELNCQPLKVTDFPSMSYILFTKLKKVIK